MKIDSWQENEQNKDALREAVLRLDASDSVFVTMLNKYDHTGEPVRFPPLLVAGFNILELENRMKRADWSHNFGDDFQIEDKGSKEIQRIMSDLKLLAKTAEGNRIAFYLCDRWIKQGPYSTPDFVKPVAHEFNPVFENKENERNYQQLKSKLIRQYGPAYRVIGMIIKAVEKFQYIDVPPSVINGVDIVKLEGEIHYAGPQGTLNLFSVDKNTSERINSIRDRLKTIAQDAQGERFTIQLVGEYGLIDKSLLFQQLKERPILDILSDNTLIKYEQSNIKSMETSNVSYDEKEVKRISESLKYVGLKEVPIELIVGMVAKNEERSKLRWETREGDIASNVDLYFKQANGKHHLNGYAVALSEDGKQFFRRYNSVDYGNTLTYKQTLNMAQGRAIAREWFEKDDSGKIESRHIAPAMFDFNDKDEKGNPKLVKFPEVDFASLVAQLPFDFTANNKAQEYFMDSLMRGNLTDCSLVTEAGSVPLKVYLDARKNSLVFQGADGKALDVAVKDNMVTLGRNDPQAEKKNDLNEEEKIGERAGLNKGKSEKGPANKKTPKSRSQKRTR